MAAFKSLCDADLDNDCDEPLVIADTPAPENITLVHLDDNEEEQEEEEEEEEIVELPVPVENHVVKHPGPPERKPPSNNTREEITPSEVKEKSPQIILNGGGNHEPNHHEVVKNSILTSQATNLDTANHLKKNNHVMKEPEKLTSDELRSIYLRNNNVRQLIYKEVKKPGKGHSELWEMLANLHGPDWVRRDFIQEVKKEALR